MAETIAIALNVVELLDALKQLSNVADKQEDIFTCIHQLSTQIDQVRDDIKELEKMMIWEVTQLQYVEVVERIKLGMKYCLEMEKGVGKAEMRYQERLKDVCANESFTLALNALLDGITGKGLFRKSILDEFYNKTKGDRPKILSLATRLLQLVCGGMIVVASYEKAMRGPDGAEEIVKLYEGRLREAYAKVESVLDTCVDNFKENMQNDLNALLDTGRSDNYLVIEVSTFMRDKYDWLENFSLVYTDWNGSDQYCFHGDRVDSLHRNGKCGIVFYRNKNEPHAFSDRYDEAYKIVNDIPGSNTQEGCKNITAKLDAKAIGWLGCAVIRRSSGLRLYGTFSTKLICIDKNNPASMSAGLFYRNTTAILLLK